MILFILSFFYCFNVYCMADEKTALIKQNNSYGTANQPELPVVITAAYNLEHWRLNKDLWNLIMEFLPGNDKGLNYLARVFVPTLRTVKNILRAAELRFEQMGEIEQAQAIDIFYKTTKYPDNQNELYHYFDELRAAYKSSLAVILVINQPNLQSNQTNINSALETYNQNLENEGPLIKIMAKGLVRNASIHITEHIETKMPYTLEPLLLNSRSIIVMASYIMGSAIIVFVIAVCSVKLMPFLIATACLTIAGIILTTVICTVGCRNEKKISDLTDTLTKVKNITRLQSIE